METEAAFDGAAFLGLARTARRDSHRLSLFARHFEPGERVSALVPVPGGTLIATDRRLLEMRSHLEVDGAWNVREFQGYFIAREVPLTSVSAARRRTAPPGRGRGESLGIEDFLDLETTRGTESFLLSRGPELVLSDEEFHRLADGLVRHAK